MMATSQQPTARWLLPSGWCLATRACHEGDEVSFRENADQRSLFDHRKAADLSLCHDPRRQEFERQWQTSLKELYDIKYALDQSAITDARWTIMYVNQKFCEISKCAPEELLG